MLLLQHRELHPQTVGLGPPAINVLLDPNRIPTTVCPRRNRELFQCPGQPLLSHRIPLVLATRRVLIALPNCHTSLTFPTCKVLLTLFMVSNSNSTCLAAATCKVLLAQAKLTHIMSTHHPRFLSRKIFTPHLIRRIKTFHTRLLNPSHLELRRWAKRPTHKAFLALLTDSHPQFLRRITPTHHPILLFPTLNRISHYPNSTCNFPNIRRCCPIYTTQPRHFR